MKIKPREWLSIPRTRRWMLLLQESARHRQYSNDKYVKKEIVR